MRKIIALMIFFGAALWSGLNAQSITITSPNGGENLDGCVAHTIAWTATGTSTSFSIDYSIDNGVNWTSVASFFNSTNGTFSWTVPNVTSSNCLVRVYDSNSPAVVDVSDATFSINGPLQLLSPNGSESWVAGTTQSISWAASGTSGSYRLEYSTDNGGTWTTIISNYTGGGGSYAWTIPNISSTTAIVRVTDNSNSTCTTDKSDNVFNLVSEIDVSTPNGGEVWAANAVSNGGVFLMNNTPVTVSTGNFYDSGGPNGNYSYQEDYTKTFTPSNPDTRLRMYFTEFDLYNSNDRLYIYNGPSTSDPLIGVYDSNDNVPVITSSHKTGALTFRFDANSTSSWQIDRGWKAIITSIGSTSQSIDWTYTGTSEIFDLEYSTNSGLSWNRIVSDYPATLGAFTWPVPNIPTTTARVRVLDHENGSIVDQSDADFTIGAAPAVYEVCTPAGGQNVFPGVTTPITWLSAFTTTSNVMIEYTIDGGTTWTTIVASTLNDGDYDWNPPLDPGTAQIRISEVGTPSNNGIGSNFNLRPYFTITSPNTGGTYQGCDLLSISYLAGGANSARIEFSTDGGATWTTIYSSASVNSNSYNWRVQNVSSSNCLIRIIDPTDTTKFDVSDVPFTIMGTNYLTLNQPNGGENWIAGNTYPITYSRNTSFVTGVNIQYSTNNGANWLTLANNEQSGSYNWTIPNLEAPQALVRVVASNNSCINDQSNASFSMVSNITLAQPIGGEVLKATAGLNGGPFFLMNNNDVTLSTGNYFDSGGPNGNYTRGENFTKVFMPSNPGHKVRVSFTDFETYGSSDVLRIYNGPNTNSPLLGSYDNNDVIPILTSTHKSGALTFRFTSSSSSWSSTRDGWSAHITTVSPENYDVQWSFIGTSEEFHYEYSSNGGSTWTRILSNVPATTGQFSWPIPNTPTTQARFRVVDADNGDIVDESASDFTILAADPTYYVCDPAPGADWFADEVRTITWNSVFTSSPNVDIEYSLDDGTTWATVVNATFNDGEYDWTVPNSPSNTARIRISDPNNVVYSDTSGRFDLRTYVEVLSPNGGQSYTGCVDIPVSIAAGGTSGTYRLELSTDGGTTWQTEATFSSGGQNFYTYQWTAKNITSNNCLIRVSDISDATKSDQSDAAFTLNQSLNVQVGQPNGSETWVAGNTYPIIYNTQGGVTNVRIYYSLDSGATWSLITSNHSGGVYNWTVPNLDSDLAMIRVQDQSTVCNADESNAVFSLVSEIDLATPNGGEVLQAVGGLNGGNFLMDNNDVTLTVGNFYDEGGPTGNYSNNRDYTKTFTPVNPTHKLRVVFRDFQTYDQDDKLYIYNGPNTSSQLIGIYDYTDNITVKTSTHKTGALTFRFDANNTSSSHTRFGWDAYIYSVSSENSDIDWTTTGTSDEFHLDYSTNSGISWNRILSNFESVGSGTFSWPVPNTPSTTARVRVVDAGNGDIVGESASDFTILGAEPLYEFCTPVTNETLLAGQSKDITWVSAFTTHGYVNLDYSLDTGATWIPIVTNTINDGEYAWIVPNNPQNGVMLRVSDASDVTNADTISYINFGPYVRLNSPNGGQNLTGCNTYNISFTAGATSGNFKLQLSTDGGSTWSEIANVFNGTTNNSYSWTVDNVTSTNCLVRVYDLADTSKSDISDAPFTVNQTLNVQVFQPNGGETWVAGNTYQITYNLQGGVSSARLMYSLNNGNNWSTIATNQNSGAYSWTVPNVDSDVALIRVQDMSTSCNADVSDANLSLVSEIALTYPNGGDTLIPSGGPNGGSYLMNSTPVTITTGRFYDTGGPSGNYQRNENFEKTFYPFNPGHKLKVVFEEFETRTSTHRLRIYNGPNTSSPLVGTYDYSDNIPVITSTHKSGALTFDWESFGSSYSSTDLGWNAYIVSEGPDNTPVTYTTTGTSSEFHYEYSVNGGLTWNRILSNISGGTGQFSWPVPNVPTTQGRFRIVDAGNNSILDESDTDFVIQSRDPLYLLCAPVTGNIFYAGRTETIEWGSAFTTNAFVDIEYSIDSGATWLPVAMNTINDGEEDWVIPDSPSTNVYVRVSDAANVNYADVSGRFTIRSYVYLVTPNGTQNYTGCDNVNIAWYAGQNSGTYRIEMSSDGGSNWDYVALVTSTNEYVTYNWTVPNIISSNCMIRVFDNADATRIDQSPVFTLTPTLNVVLGQPNGGEAWVAGNSYPITYTLQGGVTSARLEYSLVGGGAWNLIASNQNSGLYNWTVPNVDSDIAVVRVRDESNICNADVSDSVFSILSELEIITPNGGDTLKATTGPTATFFTMDNVPVKVSNGNFYDSGGPSGNYGRGDNYTKTFTPYNPSHKLQVTFTDFETYSSSDQLRIYNGPSTSSPLIGSYDYNDNIPVITSTHKTGALTFRFTSSTSSFSSTRRGWSAIINSITPDAHNITWNAIGTSDIYTLEYSTDGGSNWHSIVRDLPSGTTNFPWAIPNLPTNQGRIRVLDANNNDINDGSDQNFVIEPADPLFVICTPNGGESVFPTDTMTIEWLDAFTNAGTVMLEYSNDDGVTWNQIIASTANDGEYKWVAPYDPTFDGKIRITANNSGYSVVSDGNFFIRDYVTMVSPNSAVNLQGCSTYNIRWYGGGGSNIYDVHLSTDGGATWTLIRNNFSGATGTVTFPWTVTNANSTNCLIAVTDNSDPTKTDTTDVPFTITPTFDVQVLSPNGGEFWVAGTQQSIIYNLQGTSTNNPVNIRYRTGSTSGWAGTNVTGGSYTWTIPNTPSTDVEIEIYDATNTCKSDVSDSKFTIISEVAVTSPNGGEIWLGRSGPAGGNVVMNNNNDVTLNSGNFFDSGGENGNYGNNENYTRTFYPDIATNKVQVSFTDFSISTSETFRVYNGPSITSPLLGTFYYYSSTTPGTYTSTHPTGALTFRFESDNSNSSSYPPRGWEAYINTVSPSTPEYITWNVVGTSGIFNIEYSTNGGTTWTTIVEEYPSTTGQWAWQVPNTPSTNCLVRVTDAEVGTIVDVSDNPFEISPAVPLLINPNGGETAFSGIPFTVEWAAPTFLSANVQLEYSTNNGVTWNLIQAFTFNDGEYDWIPPQTSTPYYNCLLRISESGNTIKNDVSDANFTLSPALRITTPNSNTGNFRGCTQSTIDWVAGASNSYKIELSIDSGATWSVVESNYSNSNSVVNYPWSIPNTPSEKCLVRVTDNDFPSRTDVSDSVFTITPTITLTYPNFGGQIQSGTTANITWNSNVVSNFYDIDYSTNGGATWTNIVTNHFTTTDSYSWTVPSTVSSNCRIRVRDNLENCKEDRSDYPFTIQAAAPSITLTAPTGTDTLNGCSSVPITWTELLTSNFYNIEFSADGGANWSTIISNHFTTSGSYMWNVPNIPTNDALIRISDAADPLKTDVSNQSFVIEQSVTATISSSGGTSICLGDTVFLTSSSAIGNVWAPYGQTTQTIAVTQSGSYEVAVTSAGCVANSLPVQVTVNSLPAKPTITASGPTVICAGDPLVLTSSSPSGNSWNPTNQTTQAISISTSGSYEVTATNQFGCSATSNPTVVTVNSLPQAPNANVNSPVAVGGTINLSASTVTGATYSWTGPNGFTSNQQNPNIPNADTTMSGTYSVVATTGGCPSNPATVTVTIVPNTGVANLSGSVRSELGSPVRSTTFYLSGTAIDSMTTGLNGDWNFDVATGQSYTVTPDKRNDTITNNGVTTLDLILMRRHILNVDTLNSPYKILAADVNLSNNVSTLDLILTRALILQTNTSFPGGNLWNFVNSDFVFASQISPWPYEDYRSYTNAQNVTDQDFIGVKLGDVNNTWDPNTARTPWAGEIPVTLEDFTAAPGEEILMPITVSQFDHMSGYQMTLEWNPDMLDYLETIPGELEGQFGEGRIIEGKLATSWDEPSGGTESLEDGSALFYVRFRVKGDLDRESMVFIGSSMARAEAYTDDLRVKTFRTQPARIKVLEQAAGAEAALMDGYSLSQNVPNPFRSTTEFNFRVPVATEAAFVIYDVNGQEIKRFRELYEAGDHQLVWDGTDQQDDRVSGGVYYLRMVSGDFTATRKMILIRN